MPTATTSRLRARKNSTRPPAVNGAAAHVPTVAELFARAEKLFPVFAAGAAARERNRTLPHAEIRRIAQARLLTLRIPREHGGAGATARELFQFLINLAAVDSNIAQALRPSFLFVEGLRLSPDADYQRRWFARFLAGDVFGNAGWEVGGANGAVSARIRKEGDHFRATGSKYYSTGSLFADWVSAVALDENDQPKSFILPRGRKGLVLVDDFDAMGQRLTASGTTRLENVLVRANELRQRPTAISETPSAPEATAASAPNPTEAQAGGKPGDKRSIVTPVAQLFLGAVIAGIARNALNDAVAYTRQHARPIKHSSAQKSVDDPYARHAIGEISARAAAAEAIVLRAADTIDVSWAGGHTPALITAAAIAVAEAQFIAADQTLKAAELVFDAGGASATARALNLDRHWRNARTVANHNPRDWKAAVVGAFRLTGAEPPLSGLF
jgi:alkylation response protein AidB-like acyl-CoA dehydrogenase